MRGLLECIDIVDALSGEASLAIQILIDIGHRRRVGIDARVTRVNRCKERAMRARERDADTRLDDAVTLGYPPNFLVVMRAIQWVRNRPDQQLRRITRQHCIRIQRDYVPDELEPACIADDRAEGILRIAPQEFVELGELAAFSLPTHPHLLFWIPETRAVKEKKHILRGISVFRVQRFYSGRGSSEYLLIALAMLGWRIGEIAQDRELQVRIAIGEVLHLEMLERFINPAYAAKQCRHYDSGHVFFGNPLIAKLQLGEQSRRHQHRYQLIDDADSDFACRQ